MTDPVQVTVTPIRPTVTVSTVALAEQTESYTFTYQGLLSAYTGTGRLYLDYPAEVKSVRFSVGSTSTAGTTLDVLKNGTTSLFTTQPVISAGTNTAYISAGFATTTLARNDYLSVNVISASLSQPAADLTVTIRVRRLS